MRDRSRPSASRQCNVVAAEPDRSHLIAMTLAAPDSDETCERLIKAAMTLQPGEVNPDFLLPLLRHCLDHFGDGKLGVPLAYAIAYIDIVWHEQIVQHAAAPAAAVPVPA